LSKFLKRGLLGRRDVSWLAWSGSGTWTTGSGENSSSGSNEGEFHELNEFNLGGCRPDMHVDQAQG
jgi:hypothetical protein